LIKIEALKSSILNYISHFSMYDYVGYAWLILVFFVFIILAIFLAKKSALLSVFVLLISLALLFAGPFILKHYLDQFLRPTITKTTSIKKLTYTNALIVTGEVTNTSKMNFSTCSVDISVLKTGSGLIKNYLNQLKPIRKMTISINKPLPMGEVEEFRIVFDGYNYSKDINVSVNSNCY